MWHRTKVAEARPEKGLSLMGVPPPMTRWSLIGPVPGLRERTSFDDVCRQFRFLAGNGSETA